MKTTLAFVIAIVCAAAVALLQPSRAPARTTGSCLVDIAGYATYNGRLNWNTEYFLHIGWINESEWTGDWNYYARRYDSGFNVTYFHAVDVAGGQSQVWHYATSGNAYRRTTIATATTHGIDHWGEWEAALC